jgi:hypothetical protein
LCCCLCHQTAKRSRPRTRQRALDPLAPDSPSPFPLTGPVPSQGADQLHYDLKLSADIVAGRFRSPASPCRCRRTPGVPQREPEAHRFAARQLAQPDDELQQLERRVERRMARRATTSDSVGPSVWRSMDLALVHQRMLRFNIVNSMPPIVVGPGDRIRGIRLPRLLLFLGVGGGADRSVRFHISRCRSPPRHVPLMEFRRTRSAGPRAHATRGPLKVHKLIGTVTKKRIGVRGHLALCGVSASGTARPPIRPHEAESKTTGVNQVAKIFNVERAVAAHRPFA